MKHDVTPSRSIVGPPEPAKAPFLPVVASGIRSVSQARGNQDG